MLNYRTKWKLFLFLFLSYFLLRSWTIFDHRIILYRTVTGFYETSQKYFVRMMDEWMNNDRTIKTCHNLAQLKLTFLSKQKNIHSIYS